MLELLVIGAALIAESGSAPTAATVSAEWQQYLLTHRSDLSTLPQSGDLAAWAERAAQREKAALASSAAAAAAFEPVITQRQIGGVPVLDIRPRGWREDHRVALYFHGGAYTTFSAHSSLQSSALFADRTGLRVLAVDYTLAPRAKWQQVTGQAVAVYRGLLAAGVKASAVAIFGDSAGGGLAVAAALRLRDEGLAPPGALVLWSPWVDLTGRGDSRSTLAAFDALGAIHLERAAGAYADAADRANPYVSPVYGSFTRDFPPTLIQGGTHEFLLSDFVRLYQALEQAGCVVKLDLYEGMPHVFQNKVPGSPESQLALRKAHTFLDQYLR